MSPFFLGTFSSSLASISPDVHVWRRQVDQRGRFLVEPDRAPLSLRNSTASDAGGVVGKSASPLVPGFLNNRHVLHRIGSAVPALCPAASPFDRCRCDRNPADIDSAHGQLLLFQSFDSGALSA